MIMDAENQFSASQAVTVTAVSTNVVDLGAGDKGVNDRPMRLVITCEETATSGGATTVVFYLETDDNAAFSSGTTLFATAAIGKAALTAGTKVVDIALPHGMEQYARVGYTVATGPLTAGKFTAALVMDSPANTSYPDARTY